MDFSPFDFKPRDFYILKVKYIALAKLRDSSTVSSAM